MNFCNFRETHKKIFHETVTSEVLIPCKHGLKNPKFSNLYFMEYTTIKWKLCPACTGEESRVEDIQYGTSLRIAPETMFFHKTVFALHQNILKVNLKTQR